MTNRVPHQRRAAFDPQGETPRSVYIHIPFCSHRCGYCNFTLVAGRDYLIEQYLDALATEISWLSNSYEVDTVYLGGGTPSRLSPIQIERLGEILSSRFSFSGDAEFTAECNPVDLVAETGRAFAAIGVNRVSMGAQSMNVAKLKLLERDHGPAIIQTAVQVARTFARSVSLDLIFAAPNETLAGWKTDLAEALKIQPDHFSTYELTYEKGTTFWNRLSRNELVQSNEDLRAAMYTHAVETLAEHGFDRYEISSFAHRGESADDRLTHRSRHNQVYWNGAPFFAFGPGAARYIDGVRETNHGSTMRYLQLVSAGQSPVADAEQLSSEETARELLAIGLRQVDGIDRIRFEQRTGFDPMLLFGSAVEDLTGQKLLSVSEQRVALTPAGLMVCDSIASRVLCG